MGSSQPTMCKLFPYLGDGVMGGGCYGDGVVGGGCWGDGVVEEDVGGMLLWTTFSDLTFGDYFLLCPLSPISSFSYLNSMYMYMCTSPSSPLAPSDVSSPLVIDRIRSRHIEWSTH